MSLPLIFQFNSKYVQPYFGMEAYVKTTKSYYEDYSEEPSIIGMAGGGTLIGLKIPLPNQLNLNFGYYHGFTIDWGGDINDVSWEIKNSHFEATVQYTFKKRHKD